MSSRSARRRYSAILFLAALAAMALDAPVQPRAQNLIANPALARDLPPPGWIGDHRDAWVKQHPVYAATCETNEVTKEVRFLNRTIAYDEYLLSLTNQPDAGNPAAPNLAQVARASMAPLRRDIVVIDALVAQLQLLPPCAGSPAPPTTKAVAIGREPMPSAQKASAPSAAAAPPQAAAEAATTVSTKGAEPKGAEPGPPPTAPAPEATQPAAPASPSESDRLVIRFDDKVAALTPSGIRAFNKAIAEAKSGKPVQLGIEGCDANADFSSGAPCARRLSSLENRLKEAGIKNPNRLFGDLP
jgi:hypothetical protein